MGEGQLVAKSDIDLAKEMQIVASRPDFLKLVQEISEYESQVHKVKVKDEETNQAASEALVAVRSTGKDLEDLRKNIVAYPNKVVKTVNDTFRGLKASVDKVSGIIQQEIGGYRRKVEEEARKAAEEAAKQEIQPTEAGEEVKPPIPPPPVNTTKTESGGAVYEVEVMKFEVIDEVKLVKAALDSRSKNVPMGIVQINESALRNAINSKELTPAKWKKYGVKVSFEKEVRTRT